MSACLFCQIVEKKVPSKILFQDSEVTAFADVNPQAPFHALVVPNKHLSHVADAKPQDAEILGKLVLTATKLAEEHGLAEGGYRLVVNNGEDGGQTVFHLHLHLLGGRRFGWPPG